MALEKSKDCQALQRFSQTGPGPVFYMRWNLKVLLQPFLAVGAGQHPSSVCLHGPRWVKKIAPGWADIRIEFPAAQVFAPAFEQRLQKSGFWSSEAIAVDGHSIRENDRQHRLLRGDKNHWPSWGFDRIEFVGPGLTESANLRHATRLKGLDHNRQVPIVRPFRVSKGYPFKRPQSSFTFRRRLGH